MKIENLYVGQVVKNYKELCVLLEEKQAKGGDSKKSQLNDFERYFSYHKDGNKFVIDEIYDEAKEKVENRGANGKYSDDIQRLVLNLLAQSKGNKVLLSSSQLFRKLNMTNDNYSVARRNIPKLSEITDVSEEECYMFYDYTQSSLKSKVETALNRLRSKCLIIYNKTYTVVKRDGERNALGEVKLRKDGSFKLKEIHREATEAELALVLNYEKEVIDKLGVEDLQHIFLTGQWKSFKRIVNDMLKEQANIEYYYESYKILFNVDNIKDYLLQQDDLMEVESTLNSNIKEMINTNSNKSHDKATAWVAFGDTSDKKINIKASNKYVDNVDVLTETVIDKEAKDIREDLQKFAVKKQYEYVKTSNSDMPF